MLNEFVLPGLAMPDIVDWVGSPLGNTSCFQFAYSERNGFLEPPSKETLSRNCKKLNTQPLDSEKSD